MKQLVTIPLLALAFMFPALPAHAFFGLGGCAAAGAGGAAANTISLHSTVAAVPTNDALVRANTSAQTAKECVGDGLAYVLTESLIASMTNSIITWINSGFEGGPAFVTNYNAFLGNIAQDVAFNFIQGSELGFLCSPFENPIRLALIRDYQRQNSFSQRISCSLENSISGGFLQGDFSQGGWQALFGVALGENPINRYLQARDQLNSEIVEAQERARFDLQLGDGFLSKGKCILYSTNADSIVAVEGGGDLNTPQGCSAAGGSWEIVTPGSQINSQLSKWLGISADRLALADEIDEVMNALLVQLSGQVFTSIDGLRGLSSDASSSAFGGQSYLARLSEEVDVTTYSQARTVLINDIETAISYEETYQSILDDILAGYNGARNNFEAAFTSCTNTGSSALAATASTTLAAGILPLISDYENLRDASVQRVSTLITIRSSAQIASTADELNAAADTYAILLESGALQTTGDIAFLAQELEAQQGILTEYNTQISTTFAVCGL